MNQQNLKLGQLLIISLGLVVVFGTIAYRTKLRKNPQLQIKDFLHLNSKYIFTYAGFKIMLVGMVGGMIFGFIDNAGLWMGMDALNPWFEKKGISGNEAAGLGNTFSDGLGAFLGTFIGIIVSEMSGINLEDTPIWANAIGVIIGCLMGIGFGQLFEKYVKRI